MYRNEQYFNTFAAWQQSMAKYPINAQTGRQIFINLWLLSVKLMYFRIPNKKKDDRNSLAQPVPS